MKNVLSDRARGLLLSVYCLALAGCALKSPSHPPDAEFAKLSQEFIASHHDFRPIAGVGLGWHQYDGKFVMPDATALRAETERLKRFETAFGSLRAEALTPSHQHEFHLLQAAVANAQFGLEVQRVYWRNPMAYVQSVADLPVIDLTVYLKRDFKPLRERVRDMSALLRAVPAFLALAKTNLGSAISKPFMETGIEAAQGVASFISNDVYKAVATVQDRAVRDEFAEVAGPAVAAYNDYITWLKSTKRIDQPFALGRSDYVRMLKSEFIHLSPEQILEAGERELRAEQKRFAEAARLIDPSKPPVEVFRAMQKEHPTAEGLIPDTRKNLEAIRQFLVDHQIVTIPSPVRPHVEETLPPFRASSFASMDTPGPFEKKATDAYYYVTPVEPDWTPQQAEEWLTAFNYYSLDVTSIHEAYPGHYLQFLSLNASRAGTVEKIFGSYAFSEGWAHYTEQMMLDEGFGRPPKGAKVSETDRLRAAKYRLEQSDEALLRICRLCCSVRMHCQGMSVDDATKFFRDNCYFEEKPARSEATRGTYDPGYLYYTLGKLMILKLRQDWQAQEGPKYSLKRFHDEFLRHGAPPIPLLRRLMLRDSKLWDAIL